MITFSKLGEYGRLGNQLFQMMILYSIQEKLGYEIKLPDYRNRTWHGQDCLLDNFNISAKFVDNNDKILHQYIEPEVDQFKYNPLIYNIPDNTDLYGFFQHGKYYESENCYQLIKKELSLKDYIIDRNKEKINKIKEQYKGFEIISLHLRRGDSTHNLYGNDPNILDHNSLWYQYFLRAGKYFENHKVKFLLFTGGIRGTHDDSPEYNWCKNNFKGEEFIILDEEHNVIDDLSMMLLCNHHILSPISTFSYFVGYYNKDQVKNGKIIVAPYNYRFLTESHGENFYPPEFILV